MRRIVYLSLILFASVTARAEVTGLISNLIVTAATSAEMEETVFEPFCLVARGDSPNDLRLGDGITPGGLRVCPEGVLTNIPDSFPHPVAMNGNSIALNGAYSVGAEGPLWYLRANGSNVLSVLADVGELGSIVSEAYVGSNTLRIVVSVEDSALDPLVEFSPSLFTPAWTDCVYSATRPSANTVQLDIPLPDEERGYYRITALSGFRVRIGIPLEAPSVTADSITLGGETRTTWPSGAADVSNTAQAVLSASLASADTNSAASKQYVLDNAGTGGGNLSATNTGSAGQMLYASDGTLSNLYFAAAPEGVDTNASYGFAPGTTQTYDRVDFIGNKVQIEGGTANANTIAIGGTSSGVSATGVVIGKGATHGSGGVAVGWNASVQNSVAIGASARGWTSDVAIGDESGATKTWGSTECVYIGYRAKPSNTKSYLAQTLVGSYAGYGSSADRITSVGRSAGSRSSGSNLVFIGYYAGSDATGNYVTVIGGGDQFSRSDDYLLGVSTNARAVDNETAYIAGDIVLYDPLIDGRGSPYTNNTESAKRIMFQSGTNRASITCDFANQAFVFSINGSTWTNSAP